MRLLSAMGFCLALGLAEPAPAGEFAFDSLSQVITAQHVGSVEELLAALPEDLRTHFSLVFSSRSLQDASFEHPRAVLFGSGAQLILTFNGDPSQRGFEAVETMEFDAHANHFIFREITFPRDGAQPAARISDPNPARCSACHDHPARPIWDVPPAWPGVYGERYGAGLSTVELRGLRRFLAIQATHPRYRYLLGAAALADRDTYVSSSRATYNGASVEPPNARLSAQLATFNVRSILSELAAQPGFASHLNVLLASAGSNCGALADFYPPSLQPAIAADYKIYYKATAAADRGQSSAKTLRLGGRQNPRSGLASPAEFTGLRYVAERALNVPTRHWTLAFERGSYDMSAPAGSLSLEQALFTWLARTDPELRTVAAYRTFNSDDAYCQHLKRASQLSIATWLETHDAFAPAPEAANSTAPGLQAPGSTPTLVQQCAACHSGDIAPALPFADPSALATRLLDGNYPHGRLLDEILFRLTPEAAAGRMPRGVTIGAADQRELEEYFMNLAQMR
jgi:mono/diheme cytochrome c family protein